MRRRLKMAWTVFFAVLTVALCVLWVRSYSRQDWVIFCFGNHGGDFRSYRGRLEFSGPGPSLSLADDLTYEHFGFRYGYDHFALRYLRGQRSPGSSIPRENRPRTGYYSFYYGWFNDPRRQE